ncbi:MAG: putative uridylate kinase [Candidatus Nanosalina sp. J07AB43]|nr:MAG: putative uridylate kinase [Candidatus Nanosalina sp. J07AB43]
MKNETIVYAVGGSIVQENLDQLQDLASALQSDKQVVIVTGAGDLNRYQTASSGNKGEKDLIGIKATRLHAQTILTEMDETYGKIPETPEEIKEAASTGQNIVMGGLVPGYSTDAVAATVAELLDAKLYIATTVDGIYTDDPQKNQEAEKIDSINISRLINMVSGENKPGTYSVIDESAARIIQRSKIKTLVFKAEIQNISNPETSSHTTIEFPEEK